MMAINYDGLSVSDIIVLQHRADIEALCSTEYWREWLGEQTPEIKDDIEKAEAEFIPALLKAGAEVAKAAAEEALINWKKRR